MKFLVSNICQIILCKQFFIDTNFLERCCGQATPTYRFGSGAHSFPIVFHDASCHKFLEEGKDQHH